MDEGCSPRLVPVTTMVAILICTFEKYLWLGSWTKQMRIQIFLAPSQLTWWCSYLSLSLPQTCFNLHTSVRTVLEYSSEHFDRPFKNGLRLLTSSRPRFSQSRHDKTLTYWFTQLSSNRTALHSLTQPATSSPLCLCPGCVSCLTCSLSDSRNENHLSWPKLWRRSNG